MLAYVADHRAERGCCERVALPVEHLAVMPDGSCIDDALMSRRAAGNVVVRSTSDDTEAP